MKRKYLKILIIFVLLCVIIFLGYNIYNYINYVPSAEEIESSNIIEDGERYVTTQPVNITPKQNN